MLDAKGRPIRLGDSLSIAGGMRGRVVFSIDTDEFTPEYPKDDWAYLGRGIMVETETGALIHLDKSDEDTKLLPENSN